VTDVNTAGVETNKRLHLKKIYICVSDRQLSRHMSETYYVTGLA